MIILEGPDGAGKTTLAQELSRALNLEIHHSGGPPKSPNEIFIRQQKINDNLRRRVLRLYDRVPCISDWIYGPIVRGTTPFEGPTDLAAVAMRASLEVPIIYCRPHVNRIVSSLLERDLDEGKVHKPIEHTEAVRARIHQIVARYDEQIGYYPHWRYDWSARSHDDGALLLPVLIKRLRNQLKLEELV